MKRLLPLILIAALLLPYTASATVQMKNSQEVDTTGWTNILGTQCGSQ